MLVGALSGAKDPLQPLTGLREGASGEVARLPFVRIRSVAELDAHLKTTDRPVMLDFYADWCVSCKEIERFTFSDARVRQTLAGWILLQADDGQLGRGQGASGTLQALRSSWNPLL